jgi:hypothetical protein
MKSLSQAQYPTRSWQASGSHPRKPDFAEYSNSQSKTTSCNNVQYRPDLAEHNPDDGDWEAVFKKADERLTIKAFNQPPGSAATWIKAGSLSVPGMVFCLAYIVLQFDQLTNT